MRLGDPDDRRLAFSNDDSSDLTRQLVDAFTPKLLHFDEKIAQLRAGKNKDFSGKWLPS